MIGKRVVILPKHFDQGRKGVVVAENMTIIGEMWKIRLDDGHMINVPKDKISVDS